MRPLRSETVIAGNLFVRLLTTQLPKIVHMFLSQTAGRKEEYSRPESWWFGLSEMFKAPAGVRWLHVLTNATADLICTRQITVVLETWQGRVNECKNAFPFMITLVTRAIGLFLISSSRAEEGLLRYPRPLLTLVCLTLAGDSSSEWHHHVSSMKGRRANGGPSTLGASQTPSLIMQLFTCPSTLPQVLHTKYHQTVAREGKQSVR